VLSLAGRRRQLRRARISWLLLICLAENIAALLTFPEAS
jgi:hypothetical protein